MNKAFVIREISSGLYLGEDCLMYIENALEFESIKDAEHMLENEVYETGYYEIIPVYYIDVEELREQEEYEELNRHIRDIINAVQFYNVRIQNGEGTNWVGYFRYNPKYKGEIENWFNRYDIEFSTLKKDKYYKVTGWDKSIEQVTLQYIEKHVQQHTLDTREKWIHSKMN